MNEFYRRQFRRSQIAPGQLVRDNMTGIVRGRFALSLRAFYARTDAARTTSAGSELADLTELSTQFAGPSRNSLRATLACEQRAHECGRTADTRAQHIPFSDGLEGEGWKASTSSPSPAWTDMRT